MLVVEDDPQLVRALLINLQARRYGVDVIRGLRGRTRVPILVLSARQASDEKVAALDAGADDYITQPFSMNGLLVRLRAAVRRTDELPLDPGTTLVKTDDFTIDLFAEKAG